jgi:hypothetical protein
MGWRTWTVLAVRTGRCAMLRSRQASFQSRPQKPVPWSSSGDPPLLRAVSARLPSRLRWAASAKRRLCRSAFRWSPRGVRRSAGTGQCLPRHASRALARQHGDAKLCRWVKRPLSFGRHAQPDPAGLYLGATSKQGGPTAPMRQQRPSVTSTALTVQSGTGSVPEPTERGVTGLARLGLAHAARRGRWTRVGPRRSLAVAPMPARPCGSSRRPSRRS